MRMLGLMVLVAAVGFGAENPDDPARLERIFANPPNEYRLLPLTHNYKDSTNSMDGSIEWMIGCGFGGNALNIDWYRGYIAVESNWPAWIYRVKRSKELGLTLWLYDECRFPSGYAGGLTLKGHEELTATGYFCEDGKWTVKQILTGGNMPSKDREASGRVISRWPMPNMLMKAAAERFLAVNHEEYARRLGYDLGKYFVSAFTDEPSLVSFWYSTQPNIALPHAPDLAAKYLARTGRKLEDDLDKIGFPDGEDVSRKARYDFWNLVGDMLSENWFGTISDWCAKHGIESGGHLMGDETFIEHVGLYGDFFRCLKKQTAPGSDMLSFLRKRMPRTTLLLAASARELIGAKHCMCELGDHCERQNWGYYDILAKDARAALNWYIWGGVNAMPSYLSAPKMTWEEKRQMNIRTGRMNGLFVSRGVSAADTLIVYPAEDLMANYKPEKSHGSGAEIHRAQAAYVAVEDGLFERRRPCMMAEGSDIEKSEVRGDRMVHGKLSWNAIVLPCVQTLSKKAWGKILEFWRNGGVVVTVGTLPRNSTDAFPDETVRKMADTMFVRNVQKGQTASIRRNENGGLGIYIPNSFKAAAAAIDAVFTPYLEMNEQDAKAPIRIQRRRMDDGSDAFFVFNDGEGNVDAGVKLPGSNLVAEMWDPDTGAHGRVQTYNSKADKDWKFMLKLDAFGARIITSKTFRNVSRKAVTNAQILQAVNNAAEKETILFNGDFERGMVGWDVDPASGTDWAHERSWAGRMSTVFTGKDQSKNYFGNAPCSGTFGVYLIDFGKISQGVVIGDAGKYKLRFSTRARVDARDKSGTLQYARTAAIRVSIQKRGGAAKEVAVIPTNTPKFVPHEYELDLEEGVYTITFAGANVPVKDKTPRDQYSFIDDIRLER